MILITASVSNSLSSSTEIVAATVSIPSAFTLRSLVTETSEPALISNSASPSTSISLIVAVLPLLKSTTASSLTFNKSDKVSVPLILSTLSSLTSIVFPLKLTDQEIVNTPLTSTVMSYSIVTGPSKVAVTLILLTFFMSSVQLNARTLPALISLFSISEAQS